MLGYPPLPAEGPCASPLPSLLLGRGLDYLLLEVKSTPPTGVSHDDTINNTFIVIKAVYEVLTI